MNTEFKVTERDMLTAIKDCMKTGECRYAPEDVIAFCDSRLALLDRRNEKAKERAKAKRAEGDALVEEIYGLLTDDAQTLKDIAAQLEETHPDITVSKIIPRISRLVEAGRAVKSEVAVVDPTTEKTTHVKGYALDAIPTDGVYNYVD